MTIKITDISDMGQGIGRIDNVVVFLDGALPGDTVKAQIYEKKKKFYKAKAVEIVEFAPNRVDPKCPYSKKCGGCSYMELDYSEQLVIKERHLKEKLHRIADITDLECEPIIGMDNPYHYRNKTEFAVAKNGDVGFNKQGTNQIVDIPWCYISSPVANIIRDTVKSHINSNKLKIKKITVRTSFSTGETMVVFTTTNQDINSEKLLPLIAAMDDAVNNMENSQHSDSEPVFSLESVYVFNENKKKNPYKLIAGKRTIDDEMLGLKFEISPASFYQINPIQTEILLKKVKEYVTPTKSKRVFDLYCGVGSIGLSLADSVREVVGVEVIKDAVLNANRNAVINRIINATYITGKAEEIMDELKLDKSSIILLDPPRVGCKQEVLNAIGNSNADKIIYISCDPATYARDVKILTEYGFFIKKITPVDMFPQTVHLEIVSALIRNR